MSTEQQIRPGMVEHVINPSTLEAKVGIFVWMAGHPDLQSEVQATTTANTTTTTPIIIIVNNNNRNTETRNIRAIWFSCFIKDNYSTKEDI